MPKASRGGDGGAALPKASRGGDGGGGPTVAIGGGRISIRITPPTPSIATVLIPEKARPPRPLAKQLATPEPNNLVATKEEPSDGGDETGFSDWFGVVQPTTETVRSHKNVTVDYAKCAWRNRGRWLMDSPAKRPRRSRSSDNPYLQSPVSATSEDHEGNCRVAS